MSSDPNPPLRDTASEGAEAPAPPTLLLVEDDADLRQELAEFLRGQGYDVSCAAGVQEAEKALQSPLDLLVLDLNLPDGSGAELCNRLRPYVRCGVVICSGRSERELRVSLLRAGADAYLVKPLDPEELAATLASVLRRVSPRGPSPMRMDTLPPMWRLDRVQHMLRAPTGHRVSLSAGECVLLATLFARPDRFADRPQLIEALSCEDMPMSGPRLETLVSRLRSKVFEVCGRQLPLRASYRRGYVFAAHAAIV